MNNTTEHLNVDFSHRISQSSDNCYRSLSDTVDIMAYQATAILNVLSDQFLTNEDEGKRVSDEIIYWAIEAAIKEIKDIKQVVRAYHKAEFDAKPRA